VAIPEYIDGIRRAVCIEDDEGIRVRFDSLQGFQRHLVVRNRDTDKHITTPQSLKVFWDDRVHEARLLLDSSVLVEELQTNDISLVRFRADEVGLDIRTPTQYLLDGSVIHLSYVGHRDDRTFFAQQPRKTDGRMHGATVLLNHFPMVSGDVVSGYGTQHSYLVFRVFLVRGS